MKPLPRGYYAVQTDADAPFVFKGTGYETACFADIHAAAEAACEIPEEILPGLEGMTFTTPVLLFSAGRHEVSRFSLPKPLTLLGQNAGVSPSLPAEDPAQPPLPNPQRSEQESVLAGSFWFGKLKMETPAETLIVDGFSTELLRLADLNKDGGRESVAFRNILHIGPCGGTLYDFCAIPEGSHLHREVELTNLRVCDYDGLGHPGLFACICAHRVTLDGVVLLRTDKGFGLTDLAGRFSNCPGNAGRCSITMKDCFLQEAPGGRGVSLSCRPRQAVDFRAEDCVFVNASPEGGSPLLSRLSEGSSITAVNCRFAETRRSGGSVVSGDGSCRNVRLENCTAEGFAAQTAFAPPLPVTAPASIRSEPHLTQTEDPHEVVTGDFSALERLYAGRSPVYGDLHGHSASGGKSDGKAPIESYAQRLDELGMDFAAIVDHRQMRHFFLPVWDNDRFLMGTEPGTRLSGLAQAHPGYDSVHYVMLFQRPYDLAMVLLNFPEFEFRGDELTGFYRYPAFTRERFAELARFVWETGGILVHPHPKSLLASDDPLDYDFGEHSYLETVSGSVWSDLSCKNYELWQKLLAAGRHVRISGGADTHGEVTNVAVSTFYLREKNGPAVVRQMRTGDFSVGFAGFKMCIGENAMGSETAWREGLTLTVEVGDLFPPQYRPDHVYALRVFTDRGLAYSCRYDGSGLQRLALKVEDRRFYRADLFDCTDGCAVGMTNPIWLDGQITG